ncbi:MAG: autotransporter-associated beta strand repeat-containing protein [Prevotella sp.]|nr:autotransporter-associated beta strand repeat-containing protein [Prevotella sp.]
MIQGGPSTSGTNDALFWSHLNQRIYWDGDLLDEVLDSPGTEREAAVYKPGGGRLFTSSGCQMNNDSKNNPGALADIFGDWREEIVVRANGSSAIRIYMTPHPTEYGLYTLWHDHQYRNAMVWQSVGYNQPPHKSYFVGELEGITMAPPPFTTVGRTLIANGGNISSANADQHVMVCETNNTNITVAEGANPYIATFNVPSHVQGTNSKLLNGKAVINYEYFTCNVTGGTFTGDMRLVKQGDGILNLPKVDNTYTGSTDIWGGTVNFDGTARQSKVWMNRFAELNSDGGEFKQVEMNYDAKLRPGRADKKGQIVIADSLKLGFGSRVIFDIYGADLSADYVKAKVLTIETKNWKYGPQYLTPLFEFVSHGTETESIVKGKYLIGEFEDISGDLTRIAITGLGNSYKSSLVYEEGKLYLEIAGTREAGSVIWNGSQSGVWAQAGETNFTDANDLENTHEIFVTGDKVIFDDTAEKFNVELTGEIDADSIIVDNTRAYTFLGNGTIVGGTKLVKRGTGSLTVKTDNSYTGGTRISGGTLSVSALANANQPKGNTGAVSATYGKFIIENGATLLTTAAVTQGTPMQMLTEEGGIINNSNDFITNSGISGTKLTKRGAGWMKLNANNSGLNRLVILGGTVQCVNCTQPASTVEYQGGTLSENGGTNYAVHVPEGKTGTWNTANRSSYSNKLTGAGTLTIYCEEEKGTGWFATRTQLSMDFSEFEGTIKATGRSDDSGARWTLNTSNGMPNGTLDIAENLEVQNTGKIFAIGALAGKGKLGGYSSFSNNGGSGTNTWKVGSDKNFTWEGLVTSNSIFNKVGTGQMTVKGKWTNTGNSNVTEGILCISSGTLGTGAVNVGTEGVLIGTNTAAIGFTNSSVTVNGRIQAGVTLTSYTGTLYLGNKNLTVTKSGTLAVGSRGKLSTLISDINLLNINGTVLVYLSPNYTPAAGDSICLWKANRVIGTPTFDLPELAEGLVWDTSKFTTGYLYIRSNETDGIALAQGERMPTKGNIYNVKGQLVRKNANNLNGLPRGIYFQNGKKFVVK